MAREKRISSIKTAIIVLLILLGVVCAVAIWKGSSSKDDVTKNDDKQLVDSSKEEPTTDNDNATTQPDPDDTGKPTTGTDTPVDRPDPASFASIIIDAQSIEVFYSKGIQGFSYRVLRTASGTQFTEFYTDTLKGTKCTDDDGVFASIIKNPSEQESQTVTSTTKIGADTYGLSLMGDTCTGDVDTLIKYQTAFKNGFGSLREVN